MDIRAEGVFHARALQTVPPVVAETLEHSRQRSGSFIEERPPSVIFKSDNRAALPGSDDVADESVGFNTRVDGVRRENPEPDQIRAGRRTIVFLQQLIAPTDCEHRHSLIDQVLHSSTVSVFEILDHDLLLPVLVATHKDNIDRRVGKVLFEAHLVNHKSYVSPVGSLLESRDITTVAVKVQHLGIEVHEMKLKGRFHAPLLLLTEQRQKVVAVYCFLVSVGYL